MKSLSTIIVSKLVEQKDDDLKHSSKLCREYSKRERRLKNFQSNKIDLFSDSNSSSLIDETYC